MRKDLVLMSSLLLLGACSSPSATLDKKEVAKQLIDSNYQNMMELSDEEIKDYLFLNENQSCVAYIANDGRVDELIVCDEGDGVEEVLNAHRESLGGQIMMYHSELSSAFERAKVTHTVNLIYFGMSENPQDIIEAVEQMAKE